MSLDETSNRSQIFLSMTLKALVKTSLKRRWIRLSLAGPSTNSATRGDKSSSGQIKDCWFSALSRALTRNEGV